VDGPIVLGGCRRASSSVKSAVLVSIVTIFLVLLKACFGLPNNGYGIRLAKNKRKHEQHPRY
jgi:hypothetical protein